MSKPVGEAVFIKTTTSLPLSYRSLRDISLVEELLQPGGVVPALFETAQFPVQFNPIVQGARCQGVRFAHQSLLVETGKAGNAQSDRSQRLFAPHTMDVHLCSLVHFHAETQRL